LGKRFPRFIRAPQVFDLSWHLQNVLGGALFHPAWATLLLTFLTTIGSIFSSLLSRPMAPLLSQWFPRALGVTRNALHGDYDSNSTSQNKTPAWVRLSVLRLIGVVPWSGLNIACGVCGVSFADCFLGTFIGALPWTAVTCQVIIQTFFHADPCVLIVTFRSVISCKLLLPTHPQRHNQSHHCSGRLISS